MSFGSFMKKFGEAALQAAPLAAMAFGLPAQFAPALAQGVQIAQGMIGASNEDKAARAAQEVLLAIQQTNAIRAQHGLPPLADEPTAVSALTGAVKMTYDIGKLIHTADGTPMPMPVPPAA